MSPVRTDVYGKKYTLREMCSSCHFKHVQLCKTIFVHLNEMQKLQW